MKNNGNLNYKTFIKVLDYIHTIVKIVMFFND